MINKQHMSKDNLKVNKDLVERLAKLSRLDVGENTDELVDDFKKIISYFDELKDLEVGDIDPMTGGTNNRNVFREDKFDEENKLSRDEAIKQFPEEKDEFLRVPPIFSN